MNGLTAVRIIREHERAVTTEQAVQVQPEVAITISEMGGLSADVKPLDYKL